MATTGQIEQIAVRGQAIYDRSLKTQLEPALNGQFVAVDVDTETYVVAPNAEEALRLARERQPGKVFFLARVGARAAHFHRGLR